MNPSLEPRNRAGRAPRRFHARYTGPLNHHSLPEPVGNLPTHRSIVVVDVVAFTRPDRDNVDQLAIRDALYRTLHEAFEDSGIPWRRTVREDRGDGVLIFVSAEVSKVLLLGALPARLGALLADGNAQRAPRQRFRLRLAVHAGEVHHDAHGYAGYDVNLAFRLVDAQPLRAAMAGSAAPVGLIVSEGVHDGVLRHGYGGLDAAAFQRVRVRVKTADVVGWIQLVAGGTGGEAGTGAGVSGSSAPATAGVSVPAPRQAALVVRTAESVDKLARLGRLDESGTVGAAGSTGSTGSADQAGPAEQPSATSRADADAVPDVDTDADTDTDAADVVAHAVADVVADLTAPLDQHNQHNQHDPQNPADKADPTTPVAVLLADEASLLDDLAGLAGLGVRTVVLVGGAGLAQTLAPIARQSIYIEHELIE